MRGSKDIFTRDEWRSEIIIIIGASFVYFYIAGKIKANVMIIAVELITLFDLVSVDKRYLNSSDFVPKSKVQNPFPMSAIDKEILKDKDIHYRVLNLAANTFNDYRTSYYHKSIGGYHAAKLQQYQDIIDYHLSRNINTNVINMLNGKYIIVPGEQNATSLTVNDEALGNAWFVSSIDWVNGDNEEISALTNFNPATTAIIDNKYKNQVKQITADSAAIIKLDSYSPDKLIYSSNSSMEGLAVFSEVYYEGWKATIDGIETEIIPVDYILRAINIPAGNHKIEFTFKPQTVKTTDVISYLGIIVILLGLAYSLYSGIKSYRKEQEQKCS